MKRTYFLAGLGILAALAIVSPALGGPSLRALVADEVAKQLEAAKSAKKKKPKAKPGPAGPAGPQGPQGPQGPAGSAANLTVEPVHVVGAAGEPPFASGWANFGGGAATAGFYKDPFGIVHLRGVVMNTGVGGVLIFTLPAGYCPAQGQPFASEDNGATFAVIDVGADCGVRLSLGTDSALSLNGITFRAGN